MVLRFREDSPNILDYVVSDSLENSQWIGGDTTIHYLIQEQIFKNLEPLECDMRRCLIALYDLKDVPPTVVEKEKDHEVEKFKIDHLEMWDKWMDHTVSIVPEVEELNHYLGGETNPEPVNLWQFYILLGIGGVLKSEGDMKDKATENLMDALSGFYKVYNTDTLVLLRTLANQPIRICPWYNESRVTLN